MTKSKSSASSIVVPPTCVIHLMNGAQFLDPTGVGLLYTVVTLSVLLKYKHYYNHKD